jgi:hypothetical protein
MLRVLPVLLLAIVACAKSKSGRDWTFDRESRRLAEVEIKLFHVKRDATGLQSDEKHQALLFSYQVEVRKVWEYVFFYTVTDWNQDALGLRFDKKVGEISDPGGFSKPPVGMMDSPSQIPVGVRRPLPKNPADSMSLSQYPVSLSWAIHERDSTKGLKGTVVLRDSEDGRKPVVIRVSRESKRGDGEVRLQRELLEKLLGSGNLQFSLVLTLTPEGEWKDQEAVEILRSKIAPTEYKVDFTREEILAALGR